MEQAPLIFLSYASPDQDRVDDFYQRLKAEGFNPWMDKYEIRGGQNWDFEIKKSLQRAAIIVIFLSENSINKRGYCQREIKAALDKAQEKLLDDIYVVPIALDPDLSIPHQLEGIHVGQKVMEIDDAEDQISAANNKHENSAPQPSATAR